MKNYLTLAVLAFFIAMSSKVIAQDATETTEEPEYTYGCVPVGHWIQTTDGEGISIDAVIPDGKGVLLLGESHTNMPTHLWQYYMIVEAYYKNPNMVIAMESFPKVMQPVLDKWVKGEYATMEAFITEVKWAEVWGFDMKLYEPILRFARHYHVPIKAMNVDKALIKSLRHNGWDDTSAELKAGISKPAMPSEGYIRHLAYMYQMHQYDPAKGDPKLEHFILAQTIWDRAFADTIAESYNQGKLVVTIVGMGHVQYGWGIETQLKALGVTHVTKLLTWSINTPCEFADGNAADIFYGI